MEGGGGASGFDGGARFGVVEVLAVFAETFDDFFCQGVVFDLDGGDELVGVADEFEDLFLAGAGEGAHAGEVFADDEGLAEAFAGAFEFVFLGEVFEGDDSFIDIADEFGGEGVEGTDGWGGTGGAGEHFFDVGAFLEFEFAVAVFVEIAVEAAG